VQRPNGVAVSPDGRVLYVADSNYDPGGNRCVWAFALDGTGNPGTPRRLFSWAPGRGADGLEVDVEGNVWAAAGISNARGAGETNAHPPGVYVIDPGGRLLETIAIPQDTVTNLCFGGPALSTLYVTAGNTLFRVEAGVRGHHVYQPDRDDRRRLADEPAPMRRRV
jgi:gluconolactonase